MFTKNLGEPEFNSHTEQFCGKDKSLIKGGYWRLKMLSKISSLFLGVELNMEGILMVVGYYLAGKIKLVTDKSIGYMKEKQFS